MLYHANNSVNFTCYLIYDTCAYSNVSLTKQLGKTGSHSNKMLSLNVLTRYNT